MSRVWVGILCTLLPECWRSWLGQSMSEMQSSGSGSSTPSSSGGAYPAPSSSSSGGGDAYPAPSTTCSLRADGSGGTSSPATGCSIACGSGCGYLSQKEAKNQLCRSRPWPQAHVRAPEEEYSSCGASKAGHSSHTPARRSRKQRKGGSQGPDATAVQCRGSRSSVGLDVRGSVVVIDEAHNLVDAIYSSHAAALTAAQLAAAH